jgi:hypothetical protein
MKSLKFISRKSGKITVLAIILVITTQNYFAQIKIGGIKIDGIKSTIKTKEEKPKENTETKPESAETASTNTQNGSEDPPEWWLNVMVSDINQAKEEVDLYTNPEERLYLVSTPSSPWLLRAVSSKAREEFSNDKKLGDWRKANAGNKFDTALDELAAAAAKKLPIYIPNSKNFNIRDAALEQMIKAKLKNSATLKISKIGLLHSIWVVEKNDLGIPLNRYREAFIWAKDSADDHKYCHQYGFVIQQDYAGGGTYGATYAYLNTDNLFGCPAN